MLNKNGYFILLLALFGFIFFLGVLSGSVIMSMYNEHCEPIKTINGSETRQEPMYSYQRSKNLDYFIMDCASNSMGNTLDCGDLITVDTDTTTLYEGWIYAYFDGQDYVSHRLILCLDSACNQAVFKGDNNKVGELVNKSDIVGRVISVEYQ